MSEFKLESSGNAYLENRIEVVFVNSIWWQLRLGHSNKHFVGLQPHCCYCVWQPVLPWCNYWSINVIIWQRSHKIFAILSIIIWFRQALWLNMMAVFSSMFFFAFVNKNIDRRSRNWSVMHLFHRWIDQSHPSFLDQTQNRNRIAILNGQIYGKTDDEKKYSSILWYGKLLMCSSST